MSLFVQEVIKNLFEFSYHARIDYPYSVEYIPFPSSAREKKATTPTLPLPLPLRPFRSPPPPTHAFFPPKRNKERKMALSTDPTSTTL